MSAEESGGVCLAVYWGLKSADLTGWAAWQPGRARDVGLRRQPASPTGMAGETGENTHQADQADQLLAAGGDAWRAIAWQDHETGDWTRTPIEY